MIDTIVLMIPANSYHVTDPDRFEPSLRVLESGSLGRRGYIACKQNPTKSELAAGYYKPRLTITKRWTDQGYNQPLRIEFSAPKLLFGNNFDELSGKDFDLLVTTLQKHLKEMSVLVFEPIIRNAPVSSIHYSKNLVYTDGTTSTMILNELRKVSISKRLDLNQTDFRNSGHCLKYHANSFELAFYDKLADLRQAKISEKRAVEDENHIQLNLFEEVKTTTPFEVLRLEMRLNNRQKLRSLLKKLGVECDLSFTNLFSTDLSQLILKHYWQIILEGMVFDFSNNKTPESILSKIRLGNPSIKMTDALIMMAVLTLIDQVGTLRAEQIVTANLSERQWGRWKKRITESQKPDNPLYHPLLEVKKKLAKFEPVYLKDYPLICKQ